jgi:Putative beta-lactamase-inhibitor-like, PepSY-like
MKNLLKVSVFLGLMLAFACTKTDSVTPNSDLTAVAADQLVLAADELVAQGAGGGGDTLPNRDRHGFGPRGGGKHEHPCGSKGDSISINQLPAAAKAYLTTNKLTDSVRRVFKITLKDSANSVRYVVDLKNHKHLFFDAAGNLVAQPTRDHAFVSIAYNDLPAAAKTYLAANTDIAKITHIVKVTLPNGTIAYGVRLGDNKHLLFDAAGKLIVKH